MAHDTEVVHDTEAVHDSTEAHVVTLAAQTTGQDVPTVTSVAEAAAAVAAAVEAEAVVVAAEAAVAEVAVDVDVDKLPSFPLPSLSSNTPHKTQPQRHKKTVVSHDFPLSQSLS